jgi:WD40 repeat protein
MADYSFPVCVIGRPMLAAWLLIVLTISTTGCQTSSQASRVSASPSPVTFARPTPFPTDTPATPHDFGSLVVNVRDDTIWLLVGDGAPRVLTHGRYPRLSPDGCLAVFSQPSADPPHLAEYWVIKVDDSAASRLFSPGDGWGGLVYGMAWSPDSQSLAVTTGGDIKRYYSGDLWLVDVSDGTVTQLAERGAGLPVFSPDGEWIATYTPEIGWSHGTIGLWHVKGTSGQTLFSPLMLQYLKWADDSSGFAVALQRHGDVGLDLWWVPVDDVPMQLGRLSDAVYASWQPGTERLVFYSPKVIEDPEHQTARSFHSLHLANRDGSGNEEVPGSEEMTFLEKWALDLPDASPWSSDGRWLLTTDRDGHTYIVDTDILHTPLLLNADRVHGWLDATHYLASTCQLGNTELYRCVPPETCQSLARLAGEIQGLSYAEEACKP